MALFIIRYWASCQGEWDCRGTQYSTHWRDKIAVRTCLYPWKSVSTYNLYAYVLWKHCLKVLTACSWLRIWWCSVCAKKSNEKFDVMCFDDIKRLSNFKIMPCLKLKCFFKSNKLSGFPRITCSLQLLALIDWLLCWHRSLVHYDHFISEHSFRKTPLVMPARIARGGVWNQELPSKYVPSLRLYTFASLLDDNCEHE